MQVRSQFQHGALPVFARGARAIDERRSWTIPRCGVCPPSWSLAPTEERDTRRLSFSEFVGPCQAEWFVSHFWGSPFKDFANTIQMHAKAFAPLGVAGSELACFLETSS